MAVKYDILFKIFVNYLNYLTGLINEKEMKEKSIKLKKELEGAINLA